jgi:nucleoside-diphosphate-sugar epimerase
MTTALIGFTGFVGGAIARRWTADRTFNSSSIETFRGGRYDLVVCAGAYAEKWRINADPEPDRANIERLADIVGSAQVERLVLISTVDVYPDPQGVDEATELDPEVGSPYGRHRLWLERAFAASADTTLIRLPALFGTGLKKNAIYDLLNAHQVDRLNGRSVYQFYDIERLWGDIQLSLAGSARLVNVVTEPIGLDAIAEEVFGIHLKGEATTAGRYDVRTLHASLFNREGPYLESRSEVLSGLKSFVASQRRSSG